MKFKAGLLTTAIWLFIATMAEAGEFRRVEAINSAGHGGGRLIFKDWDGDGNLELLRGDLVDDGDAGMAGRYITLTQIYEISEGAWVARYGFLHHYRQIYDAAPDRVKRDDVKYSINGDFNADGIDDELVAEPGAPTAVASDGVEFVLRLKQSGQVLFEDTLDGVYAGPDDNFNRFELLDIDGDGTQEVLAWILSYRENDRLITYANEKSKWRGNLEYDVPNELNDVLLFLKGIRAARPEPPCPVKVKLETLKDTDFPTFGHPRYPKAKRFKLNFRVREGHEAADIIAWRDYFQKWAIAYSRGPLKGASRSAWSLHMEPEDGGLLVAVAIRDLEEDKALGWYGVWLECAFVGAESDAFNWTGTLLAEPAQVFLGDPEPAAVEAP